jgi:hypothetical protein
MPTLHITSFTYGLPLFVAAALASACADDGAQEDDTGDSTAGDTTVDPSSVTLTSAPTTDVTTTDVTTDAPTTEDPTEDPTGDTTEDPTDASTTTRGDDTTTDGTTTGDPKGTIDINRIGRYAPEPLADRFGEGATEIAAFDPVTQSLFVTNAMDNVIDVLDISDPSDPVLVQSIAVEDPTLAGPTSVAVRDGVLAAAIPNVTTGEPGRVLFFDVDGTPLASVAVGALPDMVTFDPTGQTVLVANEGEPEGYEVGQVDPEGSVSIIDIAGGAENVEQDDVRTAGFGGFALDDLDETTRIFGPGSSVAQDIEPEYVTASADGATAWATLQENNAIAIIDVATATVTNVVGLGVIDHSVTPLDPSDRDDAIAIATHPVFGMRLPDAIAAFEANGSTWLITANEGDAREYDGLEEESRIGGEVLDPTAFPDAAALQAEEALGRLGISVPSSDVDDDGDLDRLWAFGGRSVSIFDDAGVLVWDSADAMEQATAAAFPESFNATNDDNDSFDNRSDNKGPEPEGLVVGEAFGVQYVFVGLERIGGMMVWALEDPDAPELWGYVNSRDFAGDAEAGTADDLGPEGLTFITAEDSPTGNPLVVVTSEISGTVSIYECTFVPL